MKLKTLLSILALVVAVPTINAATVVVNFDSATPDPLLGVNQNFNLTIDNAFAGGDFITSGVTTLAEALTFGAGPQGGTGSDNGRWTDGASGSVTYGFASATDSVSGLLLWNYNETFGGALFSERGLTQADLVIAHSGGSTTILGASFSLTPEDDGAAQLASAQHIDFGTSFNGVTSIRVENITRSDPTFLGWQEVAAVTIPEPSITALIGLAGVVLLLRRRK